MHDTPGGNEKRGKDPQVNHITTTTDVSGVSDIVRSLLTEAGLKSEINKLDEQLVLKIAVCDEMLDRAMQTLDGHILSASGNIRSAVDQLSDGREKDRLLARLAEVEKQASKVGQVRDMVTIAVEATGMLNNSFALAMKAYVTPYAFNNIMQAEAGFLQNQGELVQGTDRAFNVIVGNIDGIEARVNDDAAEVDETVAWITRKINLFPNGVKKAMLLSKLVSVLQKSKEKVIVKNDPEGLKPEISKKVRLDIAEQLYLDTIESRGKLDVSIVSVLSIMLSKEEMASMMQKYVVLASNYQDLLVGNTRAIDVCAQNITDLDTLNQGDKNSSEWVIRKINLLPESQAKQDLLLRLLQSTS